MRKLGSVAGLLAIWLLPHLSMAQQGQPSRESRSGTASVGKMSKTEFENQNKQGAMAVAGISPTKNALSQADNALMMEVAAGGMMQLEASRVAVQKATSDQVRALAQAEVDEQTGLATKLKEIASAKGVSLPTSPDAKTQEMLTKLQGLSGEEFDRMYVMESGVNGHQKLDEVMSKVETSATDPSLKGLATAAHPLVRTHLQVSQDVQNTLKGGKAK
ncbi:DUF4142 domain-containing protein [Larkinella sp. VNQ87]|uniref:DUF4142 domain-containing protein n=1 Tax=Larkinella sp. VNQ87 TaxID=3400921 RepID=UPI003C125CA8